ncbi:MAG: glycosylhydrolase-like jelly roll fold domain-containing protein [Flavobacteriaceae bacterium]
MKFFPYQSFFIVFTSGKQKKARTITGKGNFPTFSKIKTIEGPWNVSFNSKFGGPENIEFDKLQDWTNHKMRGIKYYSGIATYKKSFIIDDIKDQKYYIDLGLVNDIARVKLNNKNIGVVWCAPWRIDISNALIEGENKLEIEVANRWINRLLGDQKKPDKNVRTVQFENGLMGGNDYKAGRYTFTTKSAMHSFKFKKPLSSGLLGPVNILIK